MLLFATNQFLPSIIIVQSLGIKQKLVMISFKNILTINWNGLKLFSKPLYLALPLLGEFSKVLGNYCLPWDLGKFVKKLNEGCGS